MKTKNKKKNRWLSLLCTWAILTGLLHPVSLWEPSMKALAAQPDPVIAIQSPEDLQKIGADSNYPMNGDYILTSDLDMSGISFTPIGGTQGEKGAVSGKNVFSGTFDGQGHLISNLDIHVLETIDGSAYAQVGLFSIIASADLTDYAEVKNLIFTDVHITADITGGFTAAGALAGEVNGYAAIDNICVLSGSVTVNGANQSDTVGAGGLIGECRTSASMGNAYISITNVYNGAEILSGSSTSFNYTGGIVGRVSGTCKTISGCVNTGRTSFKGDLGFGIAAFHNAQSSCIDSGYFLFNTGRADGSTELSEDEMRSGILPQGLSQDNWYAEEGMYPLPLICQNNGAAGYIRLLGLSLVFAEGDTAASVTKSFSLPQQIGDLSLSWETSNADVIAIDGVRAEILGVLSDTKVTLTASTDTGITKSFSLTVVSNIKASFEQDYAKPGTPLSVILEHAPADMSCTYSWSVDGKPVTQAAGNSYTPTRSDLEKFIKVVIESPEYQGRWEASVYCSELPVVYITTDDGQDVTNKGTYKTAHMRLQGNDQFTKSSTLYDGITEIKGRGNSTWDYAAANGLKKPYKLKLDKKTDILGMGKNKHWVLLANVIDHTNMRNQLMTEFSRDIGMECYLDAKPVVLILNGSYNGLYQLYEHKRVGDTRINVYDWEGLAEDIAGAIAKKESLSDSQKKALEDHVTEDLGWYDSGMVSFNGRSYLVTDYYKDTIPAFTGGFVYDMDFRLNDSKYISKFWTKYGYPIFFEAPEYAKTSETMMDYGKTYLQSFEDALHADDFYASFQGEDQHYSQLYDIDSLIQNWFLVEYSMNWDGMKNSTLMYKDLEGPLKMGPAWDFDWCWGNINMYSMTNPYVITGWHSTTDSFCEQGYQRENWNRYLISDPYFATLVFEKWQEIRSTVIEDMIKDGGKIDTLQEAYRTAAMANDDRWSYSYGRYSGIGITNGQEVHKTSELYDDAVTSMKYFIKKRVAWFDSQFTSVEGLLASWGRYSGSNELQVSDIQSPDAGQSEITASVTNGAAKKIAFYVNGIYAGEETVLQNEASIIIGDQFLREGENASNTVQIRALDDSGNFIKSNGKVLTNYRNFQKNVQTTLTGTVSIQGNPFCGSTLKALLEDSNHTGALSYQWLADGEDIQDATKDAYALTSSEIGKRISVRITSSQEAGFLLSASTEAVSEKTIIVQTEHLIIHQVYGSGAKGDTPLSHNFIELYNPTDKPVALDGYTIGYLSNSKNAASTTKGDIITANLAGTIPPHTSYLIRCAADLMTDADPHHEIPAGDLEWPDRVIDNKQYQILLFKNGETIDALSVEEDALEGSPFIGVSKQKSARRTDFLDTDDNNADFETIPYNTIDTDFSSVRPRSLADGSWGISVPEPDPDEPGGDEIPEPPAPVMAASVTLNRTSIILPKGGSQQLKATVSPANAANQSLTWSSLDPSIASVNAAGLITGLKKGTVQITAATVNGKSAKVTVTVSEVSLLTSSAKMQKGTATNLLGIRQRYPSSDKVLRWTSSNKKIASVTKKGKIKALRPGTAAITVTMKSGASASLKLTVTKTVVKTKKLSVPRKNIVLKRNKTFRLKVSRKPLTANDPLIYTSSNKQVAVVSAKGIIKAKQKGTAKIKIRTDSKKSVAIQVRVK